MSGPHPPPPNPAPSVVELSSFSAGRIAQQSQQSSCTYLVIPAQSSPFPLEADLRRLAMLFLTFFVSLVTAIAAAQGTGTAPQLASSSGTSEPPVETLHSSTRMVTLEVVARDHQGRPATGLTAKDFQVFEQAAGWRKENASRKLLLSEP